MDQLIYDITEKFLHISILISFVVGIIIWLKWGATHKSRKAYVVAPVLFFCHAGLYFILTLFNVLNPYIGAIWTDLVALHGIIIIIGGAYAMIKFLPPEVN